jgi:uncharacterized protein YlzI (FlbEa/FlbD family)
MEFLLNVDMIKTVEKTPDTVITLTNGEKIVVKNDVIDVLTKIRAYRFGLEQERAEYEKQFQDESAPADEEGPEKTENKE